MIDPIDARFFRAVQRALSEPGLDDPACAEAVVRALETGDPQDLRAARQSLESLPAEQRDKVLARAHAEMAGDLSAIWDLLPGAPPSGRPN